jgi:hypothetical protein
MSRSPLYRLVERHPLRVLDLVVVVVELPAHVVEQEEAHHLRDPPAAAHVPVADVAELLDERRLDAGLLAHLAQRRVGGGLGAVGMALRQGEHLAAVRGAARRDDDDAAPVPDDHPAR